jgi:MbtH protein
MYSLCYYARKYYHKMSGGVMQNHNVNTEIYKVVVNHEGQYSLWYESKEIPAGWLYADKTGTKEECLSYIKNVWTDMTPLSLRQHLEII